MIDLRANPFFLDDEGISWVEETLASMTLEEKAGQVFCPLGIVGNDEALRSMICGLGVGGIMYRPGPKAVIQETHRRIQNMAKIPLLLAANTEAGGSGLSFEGTGFGSPMAVAATGDPEDAYRMGFVIKEVPIVFVNRVLGTSKMNSSIFFEALWGVIKLRLDSIFNKQRFVRRPLPRQITA